MDNDLNKHGRKRKAILSPVLGIVSIILTELVRLQGTGINYGSARIFLFGILIAIVCAISGLISGIKGLESTKRWLSIIGIVVSLTALYYSLGGLLIWWVGGGPLFL